MSLPQTAPCSWSGETLRLRYTVPKIWTQKESRPFGIYWSDKLSFGRLWPEPNPEELTSFYNIDSYSEYLSGTREHSTQSNTFFSKVITKIAWLNDHSTVDPIPAMLGLSYRNATVCDVGCGSGSLLSQLRNIGAIVTGIDPSEVSAAAVRKSGIEFFLGTAETLPPELSGRRFDIVSLFQSLEHCRSPALAIRNAVSLLEPNGLLVVDVPNMGCIGFDNYGASWWHADAGRHLQFFSKTSLDALLRLCGAIPIEWEYCGFVNQFTQAWIDDMGKVWDAIYGNSASHEVKRPSFAHSLFYLPKALISRGDKKYEIIRVYARKAN